MAKSTYDKLKEKYQEKEAECNTLKEEIAALKAGMGQTVRDPTDAEIEKAIEKYKAGLIQTDIVVEKIVEKPVIVGETAEKLEEIKQFVRGKCKICTKALKMDHLCETFRKCPYYSIYRIIEK